MKDPNLFNQRCFACSIDTPPMEQDAISEYSKQIEKGWKVVDEVKIEKSFKFKNFKTALEFVNQVGKIAEEEGHHPDIQLGWGLVVISLTTHKIKGLSKNDFILAAKIDNI